MVWFLVSNTAQLIMWFSLRVWKSLVMHQAVVWVPTLWVWLWSVVGDPGKAGTGCQQKENVQSLPHLRARFRNYEPAQIVLVYCKSACHGQRALGRYLSCRVKTHHYSLGLTRGGPLPASSCAIVAKRHRTGPWAYLASRITLSEELYMSDYLLG